MIECEDLLARVGQQATIRARLVPGGIFRFWRKREGKIISFWVEGEKIGESRTGADGLAGSAYTPVEEREYRVVARCESSYEPQRQAGEATIFSRSTKREAIILDLDGTLSESSTFSSVFKRNKGIRPLKGVVEVARDLASKYDLIVLTGRKGYLRRKTRKWLSDRGFPRAPIYFSPFRGFWVGSEKFKTELIRDLKSTWENITVGIGDRDSDGRAYLANGLKTLIIREGGRCAQGVIIVRDWQAIRRRLLE